MWTYIRSAKHGEKGDLFFIKNVAVVVFGPELLAASSIKGTKRGQKKLKTGDTSAPKPGLDKDLLAKVKGKKYSFSL